MGNSVFSLIFAMGLVPSVVGLAFVIISNIMYFKRTRDIKWLWLGKHLLTAPEYVVNRFGLALTLAGQVVLWSLVIWLKMNYPA